MIDALKDLLDDHEPNVRTVAAVSLAKTGAQDKQTLKKLMKTLNDKDRLVREAGCIALGRLKAEHAVPRLVHIWCVLHLVWLMAPISSVVVDCDCLMYT